ncbi:hypothetical protein [Clostridium sp. UBA3887]|uniref:hypothetical protein n=1 Tax=Clostridium sp. UBA3887 TaxID=1946356 RepID=UPI003216DAB2
MIVDKKQYKELIKADGGSLGFEFTEVVKIKDGPDLKKEQTCNFYIYPNGIYFNFTLGNKVYFSLENLRQVKCDGVTLEIYIRNEEMIKIEIDKEKKLSQAYNVLRKKLGLSPQKLDGEKMKELENKRKEEEKELEKARKKEEREMRREERRRRIMASNPEFANRLQPTTRSSHDNVARCPKCGSVSITADKKGFSLAKGALGVATVGAYGAIAAGHGKNKVIVTCLKCGHQWKPGKK